MTKVDEALAAAAEEHADDPERSELIERARRFKSSWIELAEGLTRVRRTGQWKRWGYPSFEDYAKSELHLRQETVDKLTGSFLFLKKNAPDVLTRDGVGDRIPSYQAVDFLRRAEEQESAPREAVDEIRKRVLEDGASLPTVSRKFEEVVFPISEDTRRERDVNGLRNVARRLADLVAESQVLDEALSNQVTRTLEKLLAALDAEAAA